MTPLTKRCLCGGLCGVLSCYPLVTTAAVPGGNLLAGALFGAAFGAGLGSSRRHRADMLLSASTLAIAAWALVSCAGSWVLSAHPPAMVAETMLRELPALMGWILYGTLLGLLAPWVIAVADRTKDEERDGASAPQPPPKRIVIVGGGFAGMTTASRLEELLAADGSVSITLVSEHNALLFTPMLAEVAGGSLEPGHISAPLRTALQWTEFVRGRAESVDFARRVITVAPACVGSGSARQLPFDHLVLAAGSVSNYFGAANIQRHAFDFKTLLDAIRIRNHVIEMFERADREEDPGVRRSLVTFVVAGGGFAGVELAGALNDFSRGIRADYPRVPADEVRTILVHSRDSILPELSESLGRYARERMAARGVEFRLGTRVLDAGEGRVVLSDGEILTQTLAWTAGSAPSPWLKTLGLEMDKRGAVLVDSTMAVTGRPGLWALGDCAALKDGRTGEPCPPTAQFALREGRALALNLSRALKSEAPEPFHFRSLGALCVVGHQTACAELSVPFMPGKQVRFSGLLAWILWRSIYVSKLPGLERKIRVLVNWSFELFFPRDIVQTIDLTAEEPT